MTTATDKDSPIALVVGIGASAGGLEALERLFGAMPEKTGCAFVVVQHLSPDFKSVLDELLARQTRIPVCVARDGMRLQPDTIVLNPPKQHLLLRDQCIHLTDKDPSDPVSYPIDQFFGTLAEERERAVAIVLSGTGSDGSHGLLQVHANGGTVLAQSIKSAAFDGMPRCAIETGTVDRILAPEEMPEALLERIEKGVLPPVPASLPGNESGMQLILSLLCNSYGIDFSKYKPATIRRRVERRIELAGMGSVDAYAAQLKQDGGALDLLYKDLLIGVTRFFRDADAFTALAGAVLPELIRRLPASEELRVWVAGCATGEEAYSVAIVVREAMDAVQRTVPVKIFATDVHQDSLRTAGLGIYTAETLADVSEERRRRFFIPKGERSQVIPEIRGMVVFAPHNILKDAPFTNLDLICCRNLLIYFEPTVQRQVLSMFHFALRSQGCLFLGPSATTGELNGEFETLDLHWKLFRKRRDVRLPSAYRLSAASRSAWPSTRASAQAISSDNLLTGTYAALLEHYVPAGFLVGPRRELLHSFRGAHGYLKLHAGRHTQDLADLLEGDLRVAVVGVLQRVFTERATVTYQGVRAEVAGETRLLQVSAKPIPSSRGGELHALVVLEEIAAPPAQTSTSDTVAPLDQAAREQVAVLETELQQTRANLQAAIEELETGNEELQAANEELMAANEELQSTNEELHSVNQELHTVNSEFQGKLSELIELNADMDHLLISTQVHTLFVDRDLRIRKFTPQIAHAFNLLEQDVGRSIEVFVHSLRHATVIEDIRRVAKTGEPCEAHVADASGRWFLMRILPYRRGTNIDGAVLTLIDMTDIRKAQAEIERVQGFLGGILRNSPSQIFLRDHQRRYVVVDDSFRALAGRELLGLTAEEAFAAETAKALTVGDDDVLARGAIVRTEITLPGPKGPQTYLSIKFPLRAPDGSVGVGGINTDISELKHAEDELREGVAQRDRFLAMLSHELRNPLAAINNAATVLGRERLDDSQRTWQQTIWDAAQSMRRILDDLLDVARITHNRITLDPRDVDLRSIVQLAIEMVATDLAAKNIDISQRLPAQPVVVHGDAVRLQQVLANLLVNAVRYTPAGGRIQLSIGVDGASAVVRVVDSGIGIEPQLIERVFEPFVQGHQPGARGQASGLGLGLALVRQIVAMHGGTVSAASAGTGCGSEFTVRLPLVAHSSVKSDSAPPEETAPRAVPSSASSSSGPAAEAAPLAGRRVLLVEDEVGSRSALASMMRMDGIVVVDVGTGEEALAAFEAARPELVILDIGLPGIDGYETCRRLRACSPGLCAIALTGFGLPGDAARAKDAGFAAHLTKPVDLDDLYRLMLTVRGA